MTNSETPPPSLSETATTLGDLADADTGTLEQYYDDWARSYDDDLEAMVYVAPARAAGIMRDCGIGALQPLHDAGCGTGFTGTELQRCGFTKVIGIDISTASLDEARAKGCYATLKRQDLNEPLDFPEAAFATAPDGLAADGLRSSVAHSESQPYLPHHPDFGSEKAIIYDTFRVA